MNIQELKQYARDVAHKHKRVKKGKIHKNIFPCISKDNTLIIQAYKLINEDIKAKDQVGPAAEWLVDNFYMIEEQIKEIEYNMPKYYYKDLPILLHGKMHGLPRVYAIAKEMIDHTDANIDEDVILNFLSEYQKETSLTIAELWAVPLMLKIALIKRIKDTSTDIVKTQQLKRKADLWAKKFLTALKKPSEYLDKVFHQHNNVFSTMPSAYAERLLRRLRDQGVDAAPIIKWVDERLSLQDTDADQIIQQEHQVQGIYQMSIGNAITSLRFLSGIKWEDMFEELSLVEQILKEDPANVYSSMEFSSRDFYRRQIQEMAFRYDMLELSIAQKAIECAKSNKEKDNEHIYYSHVGYYIIGNGRNELNRRLDIPKNNIKDTKEFINKNTAPLYMGSIIVSTLLLTALFTYMVSFAIPNLSIWHIILSAMLALIPIMSIVTALFNWVATRISAPSHLPRLELKEGIPDELCTMVVIPTLITSEKRVQELVEQMEVFYLANENSSSFNHSFSL